jgi:dimethylpropiothetin dethiomethylase
MAEPRISESPDWLYLLREFYELYRYLPAGGSEVIRRHQRAAREAASRVMKADAPLVSEPPATLPVTAHLRRAFDEARPERTAPVVSAIEAVADRLIWRYGYEKLPKALERSYAYAELAGPNGPVETVEVIFGLVLFAPGCNYPAHAHDDIEESHVCLSGAVSENHQGVFAPGSLIFNPPGHTHRITVSDREPALLAYAWIGPEAALAGQKMKFSRPKR